MKSCSSHFIFHSEKKNKKKLIFTGNPLLFLPPQTVTPHLKTDVVRGICRWILLEDSKPPLFLLTFLQLFSNSFHPVAPQHRRYLCLLKLRAPSVCPSGVKTPPQPPVISLLPLPAVASQVIFQRLLLLCFRGGGKKTDERRRRGRRKGSGSFPDPSYSTIVILAQW